MSDPQQQDPLAALEELLQDSKGAGASQPAADGDQESQQAEAVAEEQKKQEIIALEEQQKQRDAEEIQAQIENLKKISDTPQEQARLAQNEQRVETEHHQQEEQSQYQIRQLGHTKV
ncbi:MAG: hypothetical protein ACOZAK_01045 [Patescibacteria group bacterium]